MHDIDQVRFEDEDNYEQFGMGYQAQQPEAEPLESFGFEFEDQESWGAEQESVFGEADELNMAAELLGVASEQELDQFLGSLIRRAGQAAGRFIASPQGRAIGGLLKGAARHVLPGLGRNIGSYLGGARGARIGSQAANLAGTIFGLELEGLSGEDQEFEVARQFVRFAGSALGKLASTPVGPDPMAMARAATLAAARLHAPGLIRSASPAPARPGPIPVDPSMAGRAQSGRWVRRGNKIVLLGL